MHFFLKVVVLVTLLNQFALAHQGQDISEEIAERNAFYQRQSKRDLSHCSGQLRKRGVEDQQVQRRVALVKQIRTERGLPQSK
jgi:hypothetical protein